MVKWTHATKTELQVKNLINTVRAPALRKKVAVRVFFSHRRRPPETWNTHFVEHAQNARFSKKFGTFGKIFQGICKIFQGIQRFSKMQDLVEKVVFLKDPISQLFERNLNIVPRNEHFVFVSAVHRILGFSNHRRRPDGDFFFKCRRPYVRQILENPICL